MNKKIITLLAFVACMMVIGAISVYNGTAAFMAQGEPGNVPSGSIAIWPRVMNGFVQVPNGYLLCDGSSYEQSDYPELAYVLDCRFGCSGSKFNVPDMEQLYVKGWTQGDPNGIGETGGAEIHSHNLNTTRIYTGERGNPIALVLQGKSSTIWADSNPPYMTMAYIIKT